jgi:hypothetical protein
MAYDPIAANDIILMREKQRRVDKKFDSSGKKVRLIPVTRLSGGRGYTDCGRRSWFLRSNVQAEAFYHESVGPDIEPSPVRRKRRRQASDG